MELLSQHSWFSEWFNQDYLKDLYGDYTGRSLTPQSPRAIITAQR